VGAAQSVAGLDNRRRHHPRPPAGFEEVQSQRVAAGKGSADDRMDLPHRRGRHRSAHVQAAALGGAVVLARRAMLLDEPVTTATSSATTQFGVERLEVTGVELVDAFAAKIGLDASVDVADVRAAVVSSWWTVASQASIASARKVDVPAVRWASLPSISRVMIFSASRRAARSVPLTVRLR
jgi:hypothetical protein